MAASGNPDYYAPYEAVHRQNLEAVTGAPTGFIAAFRYRAFLDEHRAEYERRGAQAAALYAHEVDVGRFTAVL